MMNKMKLILLAIFPGLAILILGLMVYNVKTNPTEVKPITAPTSINDVQIVKVQATAFCEYGVDENGLDYGPGYVIVSAQGEIPLYSLLDIDIYGEAQAVAVSNKLAPNEIRMWYNAPSKVLLFEPGTAYVRILGIGDPVNKNY
jgi:3D (Asp-Asp-Asp) domain-containing protein